MSIRPLYEFDEPRQQEIVKRHLSMPRGGEVTGPIEGKYGSIYSITLPNSPMRIAAKCPRIRCFETAGEARHAIENILHELEKTHSVFKVPWINRIFDVQIVHGWPFILSRFRDGTLGDLIANPLVWTRCDRLISMVQVARALRLARERGIAAHQDLKPGNVFFDDLSRKSVPRESKGMHFHIFVGDFGLADAFREFGCNQGSRPYMAPEQFDDAHIDPTTLPAFDIFALAVMASECLLDGVHPCGVTTRDCWPWQKGMPRKWDRESTWRQWAKLDAKKLPGAANGLSDDVRDILLRSLSIHPQVRPSLQEFEDMLWRDLAKTDDAFEQAFRMQIKHIEGLSSGDAGWPHMDERLSQLREFYSSA